MTIEGALSLTVHWDGAAIAGARVRSSRRTDAGRVLEGRSVADALATIPVLFAVCRRSQQAAATLACALARGEDAGTALPAQGELAALSEYALETLWRLLLDVPRLAGEAPRHREFAAIRASVLPLADQGHWFALADTLERVLVESVYGMPLAAWRFAPCREWLEGPEPVARMLSRLAAQPGPEATLHALPWIDAEGLASDIAPALDAAADYGAAPVWRGAPAETGALPRTSDHPKVLEMNGHAFAARIVARLVELATIPARIRNVAAGEAPRWVRGARPAPGRGLAAVETARGTLIHSVIVEGDRIAAWRIVAPTEWNFHPAGAFARGLVGTPAATEAAARAAAERWAFALDPCVASEVAVAHA